jgi:hypothetical protein
LSYIDDSFGGSIPKFKKYLKAKVKKAHQLRKEGHDLFKEMQLFLKEVSKETSEI